MSRGEQRRRSNVRRRLRQTQLGFFGPVDSLSQRPPIAGELGSLWKTDEEQTKTRFHCQWTAFSFCDSYGLWEPYMGIILYGGRIGMDKRPRNVCGQSRKS